MRVTLGPILFLGFVQTLQTQNRTDGYRTKASSRYRDPSLSLTRLQWPNRTGMTNEDRIKVLAVALRNAEKELNVQSSGRNEERLEKPRIFGSPIMAPELRPPTNDTLAAPRRRNVRPKSRTIDGRYSAPSPVLLPPYRSYSPEYDFYTAEKTVAASIEDSRAVVTVTTTTAAPNNSTVGRIQIYEVTTVGSKDGGLGNRPVSAADYLSAHGSTLRLNDSDTSNAPASRGSTKYRRQNVAANDVRPKRKEEEEEDCTSSARRPVSRSRCVDSDRKIGAIPGVPGRDYPVHQEHTHRHLRYSANRFLCPVTPGTHIYLADRASRCQIFYVCHGEQTGVPMVCPNGTLFSEPLQVCDWWFNVAC